MYGDPRYNFTAETFLEHPLAKRALRASNTSVPGLVRDAEIFLLENQHLTARYINNQVWFSDRPALILIYKLMRLKDMEVENFSELLKQNLEKFSKDQLVKRYRDGLSWSFVLKVMEQRSERLRQRSKIGAPPVPTKIEPQDFYRNETYAAGL